MPRAEPLEHARARAMAAFGNRKAVHDPIGLVVEPGVTLDHGVGGVRSGKDAHDGNGARPLVKHPEGADLKVLLGVNETGVVTRPLGGVAVGAHEDAGGGIDGADGLEVVCGRTANLAHG